MGIPRIHCVMKFLTGSALILMMMMMMMMMMMRSRSNHLRLDQPKSPTFCKWFYQYPAYKQQTTQIPHGLNLGWGSTGGPVQLQAKVILWSWSHGQLRKRFIHPNPPQTPFLKVFGPSIFKSWRQRQPRKGPSFEQSNGPQTAVSVVFAQWFGGDRRFRRKRRSFKGWNIESMPVQTSAPYFRYLRWLKPSQVFRKCCFHITCPSRMLFYQYLPWPL